MDASCSTETTGASRVLMKSDSIAHCFYHTRFSAGPAFQENQGGTLLNTGPHAGDQAILLNEKNPKIFCCLASNNPFNADDFYALTLYGKDLPTVEVLISSYCAYDMGSRYVVNGQYGSLSGNEFELNWKYFDPKKAPQQKMWSPWSKDREYPREELPWQDGSWNLIKLKWTELKVIL